MEFLLSSSSCKQPLQFFHPPFPYHKRGDLHNDLTYRDIRKSSFKWPSHWKGDFLDIWKLLASFNYLMFAWNCYSLSKKCSAGAISSFRPFLFLVAFTTAPGLEAGSLTSPVIATQWSKTHWGKAWPPVLDLRSAVNPSWRNKVGILKTEIWFYQTSW